MFGGLNPKKMQAMMKQMGIAQEEIFADKVIIEKRDGSKLIIEEPSVIKIKMQGQTSFQITGEEKKESEEVEISEDDIKTVIEKTGCTKEQAEKSLEETGDLAESILELSE
jgi:nascent polypeptide-associated complex subunit alpha